MLARTITTGLGISCMPPSFHRFPLFPFTSSSSKSYFSQWKLEHPCFTHLALFVAEPSSSSSFLNDDNELASIHEHSDGSFTFSFGQPPNAANTCIAHHLEASSDTVDHGIIITENADFATAKNGCSSKTVDLINSNRFFFQSGIASLSHPLEAFSNGVDAVLSTPTWFGVADGAKQWAFEGNCTGHFAEDLMKSCEEIVSDSTINEPKEVLSAAAALAQASGLSTCLIAHVYDKVLHVANVGNSGFLVVRKGEIFECLSPTFQFNFPVFFGRGDDPTELIKEYNVGLAEGDIVVCGTVGLFDNVYEEELAAIVKNSRKANRSPQEMAELIAKTARALGQKRCGRSPFADAAEAAGYALSGGKVGDVTVIVSLVELCDRVSPLLNK